MTEFEATRKKVQELIERPPIDVDENQQELFDPPGRQEDVIEDDVPLH